MQFSSWQRIVNEYRKRMIRLLGPDLMALIENPSLSQLPKFKSAANAIAEMMVAQVDATNSKSWRSAAQKSTRAREIFEALREEVYSAPGLRPELRQIARNNAELISSIPDDIARSVTRFAAELQRKGARPEELEREIRKRAGHLTKSKIELIARTEISKAETDLTRARSERIGIEWYQWESSRDSRVRPSHQFMNGVLVPWSSAPSPEKLVGEKPYGEYHAGQTFNCRCVALPVADLSEVRWPCRVYANGSVTRMTRAKFVHDFGFKIAA